MLESATKTTIFEWSTVKGGKSTAPYGGVTSVPRAPACSPLELSLSARYGLRMRSAADSHTVIPMTVLNSDDGLYAALKIAQEGTRMTIYTKDPGASRTNVVAELCKTIGNGWHDWDILRRPATADHSLLVADWPDDDPPGISSRKVAETLTANRDLWAQIDA